MAFDSNRNEVTVFSNSQSNSTWPQTQSYLQIQLYKEYRIINTICLVKWIVGITKMRENKAEIYVNQQNQNPAHKTLLEET